MIAIQGFPYRLWLYAPVLVVILAVMFSSMAESHGSQHKAAHGKDDHVALRCVVFLFRGVLGSATVGTDPGAGWYSHPTNATGVPLILIGIVVIFVHSDLRFKLAGRRLTTSQVTLKKEIQGFPV